MQMTDWKNRWIGGFCAPGIYGMPVRDAGYQMRPTIAQLLAGGTEAMAVEERAIGEGQAGGRLLRRRHGRLSIWQIARKLRGGRRGVKGGCEKVL